MNPSTPLRLLLPAALLLAACPRVEPAVIPDPPKVNTFTVSPAQAAPGATLTLTWDVEDATSVSIRELASGPVAGVDDKLFGSVTTTAAAQSAFFILTAENVRGVRATAVASVQLDGTGDLLFEAVPELVGPSETAMLVWAAPGARTLTITDGAGAMLNLNGQVTAGSVMVNPAAETTYTLRADGRTATATVARSQAITELTVTPAVARPGQPVTVAWKTANATRVTLTSPGIGTLANETEAAKVASGMVTQIIPDIDMELGVPFVLRAEGRGPTLVRTVTVYLTSVPTVLSATAPQYARTGGTFPITWTSRGADRVRILVGGVVVHQGPPDGSVNMPTPAMDTDYSVIADQTATGDASAPTVLRVSPVGVPTVVSFTASVSTIAQGGDPVTLTWNVANAREVTIIDEDGLTVAARSGAASAQGTVTVYPNRPTTRYVLDADNGAGESIAPASVTVAVTTVATLTFSRRGPVGSTVQVTGSTVTGGGAISGLATSRVAPASVQFVDISATGRLVTFSNADTGYQLIDIGPFSTVLFGKKQSGLKLNVAVNGFLSLATSGTGGATTPTNPIGTGLTPFAMAVFYGNLRTGPGTAQWQLDTVDGERRLIVQWNRFEDQTALPMASLTFQAQVYSSGRVVYAYREVDGWSGVVSSGIVRPVETEPPLLSPIPTPSTGDVVEFFGEAALPAAVRVEAEPLVAYVKMPQGLLRVEGDPRLASGELAITEVNPRPLVAQGEWLEISNFSAQAQDISGWTLRTDAGTTQTLPSPLVVPAGGRVLVAEAAGANDGLTVDGVYSGRVSLPDGGGGAVSLGVDNIFVSAASLALPGIPTYGASVQADPPTPGMKFPSTTLSQLTCATDAGTYGSNGQVGSPGQPHGRCFPYVLTDAGVPFVSIAASGSLLLLGANPASDDSVLPLSPGGPVQIGYATVPTLYVSTNGFISPTLITTGTGTNKTTPSGTAPVGVIAPFWDELKGGTEPGSGIYWERRDVGTPDESVIVSWERWRIDTTTVNTLNFQARFWASGDITYAWGDMTAAGTSTIARGSSATAWLEEPGGRAALTISTSSTPGINPNTSYRFKFTP